MLHFGLGETLLPALRNHQQKQISALKNICYSFLNYHPYKDPQNFRAVRI